MSDIVVRHRLFWNFFILSTEKWLGDMASSGLSLYSFNYRGTFSFKREEPHQSRYCFTYVKFGTQKCHKKNENEHVWEELSHHDKWRVYRCPKTDEAGAMPNRRGLYLRNNSLLCLYAIMSSLFLLAAFGVTLGLFAYLTGAQITSDTFFRGAVAVAGIFAVLLLANFVLFMRMSVTNDRILEDPGAAAASQKAYHHFLKNKTFETWLEKLLIKDGDIIKRFKPFWILSPRAFEKWLMRMEKKGLNIYKIHKSGVLLYFIKNAPRKICYYVINSEGEDVSSYLDGGWRIVYSSTGKFGRLGRVVLLSHTYEKEAPVPFHNEKEFISNAARITLRCISSIFIFLIILLALFIGLICFKADEIWVFAAGAALAFSSFLIIKMLFYFAHAVKTAHSSIFTSN